MGIVPSLILIAAGAILTWAVTATTSGINLHTVGIILMIIGTVGFVLSLIFWSSWFGPGTWSRQRSVPVSTQRTVPVATTQRVVEEDVAPR